MPRQSTEGFIDRALISDSVIERSMGGAVVYSTIVANSALGLAETSIKSAAAGANRALNAMLDSENTGVFALGVTVVAASGLAYGIGKELQVAITK